MWKSLAKQSLSQVLKPPATGSVITSCVIGPCEGSQTSDEQLWTSSTRNHHWLGWTVVFMKEMFQRTRRIQNTLFSNASRQIRRKSLQNVYHFTRTLPLVGFFYKFRHTFLNSSASFWCSVSNWLRGREAAKLQEYSPSPDGFFAGFWCHISGDFQGFNQQISGF